MNPILGVPTKIRMYAWAIPGEGVTLKQLEAELHESGTQVLEIDELNNRIKVADVTEDL